MFLAVFAFVDVSVSYCGQSLICIFKQNLFLENVTENHDFLYVMSIILVNDKSFQLSTKVTNQSALRVLAVEHPGELSKKREKKGLRYKRKKG